MEDKDFDKFFRGVVESPPAMAMPAAAALDMKYKLREAMAKRKRRRFLWWLIPLLALPIIFGSYFLNRKFSVLNTKINDLNEQLNKTVIVDSVFQKHTTYQFDTIHNVIYKQAYSHSNTRIKSDNQFANRLYSLQRKLPENFFRADGDNDDDDDEYLSWGLDNSGKPLLLPAPSSSFYHSPFGPSRQKAPLVLTKDFRSYSVLSLLDDYPFLKLADVPLQEQFALVEEYFNTEEVQNSNPLLQLVPIGFRVKLSGNPIVEPVGNFGGQGYGIGLKGEIEFVKNISLEVGAEYFNRNFEIKGLNMISQFPQIDGTEPQDILFEVKPSIHYIQFPVMFRKKFLPNKKLNPILSAGMVSYRPITQTIVYEFFGDNGEYKLSQDYKQGAFSFDNLRVGLGAEYQLAKRLSVETGVQYQHGFSQHAEEFFALRYWAWDLNFNYRLY